MVVQPDPSLPLLIVLHTTQLLERSFQTDLINEVVMEPDRLE
jgi:hypothetical protein